MTVVDRNDPCRLDTLLTSVNRDMTILDVAKDAAGTKLMWGRKELPPDPPQRAESPPPAHVFAEVGALVSYLRTYATSALGQSRVVALADVPNEVIRATIDETQTTGRVSVEFRPQAHPLLQPWLGILGRKLEVADFARFVMQRRRSIVSPDGRELALILSQITAQSTFTLHAGTGKDCLNGLLVHTRINGNDKTLPMELPETIALEVPIYLGLKSQRIELDLLVSTDGPDTVVVVVTAADLAEKRLASFLEMLDVISESIEGVVGLGTLKYGQWDYLPTK